MPELIMRSLAADVDGEYTDITFLDPKTNRIMERCELYKPGDWKTRWETELHEGGKQE